MQKIFRDEVIENQRYRLHGSVAVAVPRRHWAFSLAILAAVVLVGVFLVMGSYTSKERVQGFLIPDRGVVKIHPIGKGVIQDCAVSTGDRVEAGDRLCSLVTRHGLSGDTDRDTLILEELRRKKGNTERLLEKWRGVFRLEAEALRIRKEGLRRKISDLGRLRETHRRREELIADRVSAARALKSEGHLSGAEHQRLEALFLEKRLDSQRVDREMTASRDALEGLETEIARHPYQWELKRLELEARLSDIDLKIAETEGRRSFVISSPIRGTVTAFQAVVGQAADPSIPLMAVLPGEARMKATLLVPGRAVGLISPGQEVFFRYAAFPHQRYGLHHGRIEEISRALLTPREIASPVTPNEPVYKVSASLESESISAYGKEFPLQAGMLLEADIIQGERSLLEWIMDPIYRFRGAI